MKKDFPAMLAAMVVAAQMPEPQKEYKFHPVRKWRIDLAWPALKLAVEVEGGIWIRGRHTRPSGFIADMEKYNNLCLLGWSLLRVTTQQVRNGKALELIELWIKRNYIYDN
jgi:very-short-patch-repair endonuclease